MTAKAGSHTHPRYKQVKDTRQSDGIVSAERSGELSDQKRLQSWSAGQKIGKLTNSMVGSFHVILVQEAESHFHETVASAPAHPVSQRHFRASWCEDRRSDPGHVKARFFRLDMHDGQVEVEKVARTREQHVLSRLRAREQHHGEETRRCRGISGSALECR